MSVPALRFITKEKRERIVKVARDNPEVSLCHLAERFGVTEHVISNALLGTGIRRDRDGEIRKLMGRDGRPRSHKRKAQ